MKHIAFKTTLILFVLSILTVSADSFAKSKYERITNGIGNLLSGKSYPTMMTKDIRIRLLVR